MKMKLLLQDMKNLAMILQEIIARVFLQDFDQILQENHLTFILQDF